MKTRGKFICTGKINNRGTLSVEFEPVTAGSEENDHFSEFTPFGALILGGVKQEVYDGCNVNDEYYVDVTPVKQEVE